MEKGLYINGKFVGEVETIGIFNAEYTPTIGDNVAFVVGEDVYTGGKITDIVFSLPYVNGIRLTKDTKVWKVND